MLLLGLTTTALCQEETILRTGMSPSSRVIQPTEAVRQTEKERMKADIMSAWNDDGTHLLRDASQLLFREDFREANGISDEQFKTIWDIMIQPVSTTITGDPVIEPMQAALDKMRKEVPGLFRENASEEMQQTYNDLQRFMIWEIEKKSNAVRLERNTNALNENLSPEQMKKFVEYQISTMSESQFICLSTRIYG